MKSNWITEALSMAVLTTMLPLAACGDDAEGSGGSSEAASTTSSGTTLTSTNTGATSTSTGTVDAPLTVDDLAGSWSSAVCEAYPDGMGGTTYLKRDFTFTGATWALDLDLFGDDACSVPLFSAVIEGPFSLGDLSAVVDGATEGKFGLVENVWTAHQASIAELFTSSGCGAATWEVGVPQDVSATGCIGVAHPVSECPTEYDIVSIQGAELFFGARLTDLCIEAGRPTMLGAFGVTKEP